MVLKCDLKLIVYGIPTKKQSSQSKIKYIVWKEIMAQISYSHRYKSTWLDKNVISLVIVQMIFIW